MGLSRKRTQQLAYFAGLFDGEGHISIHDDSKGGSYCHVVLSMVDPEAVMLLANSYPECRLYLDPPRGEGKRIAFRFVLTGYNSFRFLQELKPYLIVKQRQARIALAYLAHRRRTHRKEKGRNGHDCKGRCMRFAEAIRAVRKEAKGAKSVNALLSHGLREYRAKREEMEADVAAMVAQTKALLEGVETRHRDIQSR